MRGAEHGAQQAPRGGHASVREVTHEISAAESVRGHGAEAGGEPTSLRAACGAAARHPIAAHAADPSAAVPQRTTGPGDIGRFPPSQNSPGGSDAARLFWQRVGSGEIRLQPHEDRLIWTMREHNRPWHRIAARIVEMRAVAQHAKPRTIQQYRRAMRAHRIAQSVRKMLGKS